LDAFACVGVEFRDVLLNHNDYTLVIVGFGLNVLSNIGVRGFVLVVDSIYRVQLGCFIIIFLLSLFMLCWAAPSVLKIWLELILL
jgi:hypothetical protein